MLRIASGILLLPSLGWAFVVPLQPFFETHCYTCHDDDLSKADLDLTALSTDLEDPAALAKWVRIFDRVAEGEMPPAKKPRPELTELEAFQQALAPALIKAHAARKGTVLRRLNRREYENTLNDLFGTSLRLARNLPEDGRSHEFDTVGEALGISSGQLQLYLEAIDRVLGESVSSLPSALEPKTWQADYASTPEGERHIGKAWGKAEDGAVLFFRELGYPTGMLRGTSAKERGLYRVRITGYAHQSARPITFRISGKSFRRGSEQPTFGYLQLPPGKPTTVELEARLERGAMIEITTQGLYDPERKLKEGSDGYDGPGLAINHVEMHGPLHAVYPLPGHELVVGEIERTVTGDKPWNIKVETRSDDPLAAARRTLEKLAPRAFRRPVETSELAPYLALFESELEREADLEAALRTAVAALFCAPDFLYLRERPGRLDDHALAARLSYLLTRTAPDAELRRAAEAGQLAGGDPTALLAQAERLMKDDRFDRFVTDFCDAWLDLRDIEFTAPDRKLFPEFDRFLQDSMLAETRGYLRHLVEENLPARNVVKADFAILNSRLAEHYGIEGVEGPEIRPVPLPPDHPRGGGFLTQGSVLKVTANGTNTSPVLRGVWILERILGDASAPPPPGIPGVEPDTRGAETLREILEKHRDLPSCNSCHVEIDPPGFALESFDPIGGWRDHYRSLGEGEKLELVVKNDRVRYRIGLPVDSTGAQPDGRPFTDIVEYCNQLAADEDALARTLVEKLLTFGTGRELGFSDRSEVEGIVAQSREKGHGVRDILRLAIASEVFRTK